MKNLIYAICFVLLSSSLIFSQVRQVHVTHYSGNSNGDNFGTYIKTDSYGNYFVAGRSTGNGTKFDYALMKYSSSGKILWERRYNGESNGDDVPRDLHIDDNGNAYITGYSTVNGITRSYECVTIKYRANGDLEWMHKYRAGSNVSVMGHSVKVTSDNDVIIGAYIGRENAMDFLLLKLNENGEKLWERTYSAASFRTSYTDKLFVYKDHIYVCGGTLEVPENGLDFIVMKYDLDGNFIWKRTHNGNINGIDIAKSIYVDKFENVYVTGYTENKGTYQDITTIKYNANGELLWVTDFNGTSDGYDWPNHVLVDDFGNVYVEGGSQNDRELNPNCESELGKCRNDGTLIKYLSNGQIDWVRLYNGPDNMYDCFQGMAIDKNNNIYVAGRSHNEVFSSQDDIITLKYNTRGEREWIMKFNGAESMNDYGEAVAVDQLGNVYTAGWSETTNGTVFTVVKYSPDDVAHDNIANVSLDNYPNPFNPVTKINFTLSTVNVTSLKVFNSLGQEVTTLVNGQLNPGYHEYTFDASGLASGVYFYRLSAGDFSETKRMLLVK